MPDYLEIYENLKERIHDLKWVTYDYKRTRPISAIEAKIFYDHLISTYERMVAYEPKIEATTGNKILSQWLQETQEIHRMVIDLKVTLQKIISSTEATSPTVTKVDDHSIKTEPSKTEKKLDFHIRQQIFLIRQIESLEIPDDICAVKAEVMYNHLSQLYNSFISNQMQTEASVDDDATLENQQKIAKETQQKVIDFQTKLKKIMQPIASISSAESKINIDYSSQSTQTDTEATSNVDLLIKKRESVIERLSWLEPEEDDVTPEQAEIIYNHFNSLYQSYNSIQIEIESRVSGSTLDSELKTSKKIQKKMIENQTTFKKFITPQFKAFSSEQIKSSEENNLQHETEINISNISKSMNDHLKISKEIQTQITSLQKKLNTFVDSNQKNEMKNSGKLEKILEINDEILDTQQKLSSSIIRCLSQRK